MTEFNHSSRDHCQRLKRVPFDYKFWCFADRASQYNLSN